MWLSERNRQVRRIAALSGVLALTACGFQPVYAPGGPALALRDTVIVQSADTPFDYRLRMAVQARLGQANTARFVLVLTSDRTEVTAAIAPDGAITRYNLTGRATWALNDAVSGAERATAQVDSFTSYSATGTTVATRSAEDDASDRLAAALADLIVAQLVIAAQDLPAP